MSSARPPQRPGLLSVFGLALGCGTAILIVRLLLMPVVFSLSHTSNWMLTEGGTLAFYLSRTVVWALIGAAAAALTAMIHNEFVRRSL